MESFSVYRIKISIEEKVCYTYSDKNGIWFLFDLWSAQRDNLDINFHSKITTFPFTYMEGICIILWHVHASIVESMILDRYENSTSFYLSSYRSYEDKISLTRESVTPLRCQNMKTMEVSLSSKCELLHSFFIYMHVRLLFIFRYLEIIGLLFTYTNVLLFF